MADMHWPGWVCRNIFHVHLLAVTDVRYLPKFLGSLRIAFTTSSHSEFFSFRLMKPGPAISTFSIVESFFICRRNFFCDSREGSAQAVLPAPLPHWSPHRHEMNLLAVRRLSGQKIFHRHLENSSVQMASIFFLYVWNISMAHALYDFLL
jgi:hypothetical protein